MVTETPVNIASLTTCTPGAVGGEPCIAGIRMPVKKIATLHNQGLLAEEIVSRWQPLNLAGVHAAFPALLLIDNGLLEVCRGDC